jgi:hypothetical protein
MFTGTTKDPGKTVMILMIHSIDLSCIKIVVLSVFRQLICFEDISIHFSGTANVCEVVSVLLKLLSVFYVCNVEGVRIDNYCFFLGMLKCF